MSLLVPSAFPSPENTNMPSSIVLVNGIGDHDESTVPRTQLFRDQFPGAEIITFYSFSEDAYLQENYVQHKSQTIINELQRSAVRSLCLGENCFSFRS